ncbi:unnamed protein product, partial [marine sediment metagenome]
YTSISEEHQAVREAVGLFDVTHMGVIKIAGEHAASFLDTVSTNYVRWLKDGQSQQNFYQHKLIQLEFLPPGRSS